VINVGATTETEMHEKKLRIDDALQATKAAVEEGVVVGGGLTLLHAQGALDTIKASADEIIGVNMVKRALEEPLRQIAKNGGREGADILATIRANKSKTFGFNARTNVFEDLAQVGVMDPTKVVRNGIQNAASIAGMVLTTEGLVADFDEDKQKTVPTTVVI
jgi:chaperonin GroEL